MAQVVEIDPPDDKHLPIIHIMLVDDLVMQGARSSAAMVLI